MFELNIALQSLLSIILILALLFFFLLGYTFWTRTKRQYWNEYEQKFRDQFFSLLLDYAEESDGHLDADKIIKKISKRSKDYSFFLKLLDELDSMLFGPERNRLDHIMQHSVFASFYENKLFEFSTNSKLYACIYFLKSGKISPRVLLKLKQISKSSNLKLSFAASKALQNAEDWSVRKNALLYFFKRSDISELMIAELLHQFDSGLAEDRNTVSKILKELLLKEIDSSTKNIIVRYMGHQQFLECSEFLYEFLENTSYNIETKPLIRGLITAMGELYYTESAPIIKLYCGKEISIRIRLAAVKALSTFGGEDNITFLLDLLPGAEFAIRRAIIYELVIDDHKLDLLTTFVDNLQESIKQLQETPKTQKKLIAPKTEVLEISNGVNIALNQRQAGVYV